MDEALALELGLLLPDPSLLVDLGDSRLPFAFMERFWSLRPLLLRPLPRRRLPLVGVPTWRPLMGLVGGLLVEFDLLRPGEALYNMRFEDTAFLRGRGRRLAMLLGVWLFLRDGVTVPEFDRCISSSSSCCFLICFLRASSYMRRLMVEV